MIKETIGRIIEKWFISDPGLFGAICTHSFSDNMHMKCPMRTGKGYIEYNSEYISQLSDSAIEGLLKVEAIRILLKHPYERKPDFCSTWAAAIGSNLVIGDNYNLSDIQIDKPEDFELEMGKYYEWYCRNVQNILNEVGDAGAKDMEPDSSPAYGTLLRKTSNSAEIAELWDEDDSMITIINNVIKSVKNWGSLGGRLSEMIEISTQNKINWKNVLHGFRASILSSKVRLTRMRPNRRTGFDQMGTTRMYITSLLIAVDVSGSISKEELKNFYSTINSAFKYGFQTVDVIQFDCGVRVVQSIKHVLNKVHIIGRGGTSFNEPIQYAHEHKYDGLVIMTDGFAPEPMIPSGFRCRILWMCKNQECYDDTHQWMQKSGRVCVMK